MLSTIDSWASSVSYTEPNKVLNFLQGRSHNFSEVIGFFLFIVWLGVAVSSTEMMLPIGADNQVLAKFLLICFGLSTASYFLGKAFGELLESAVDSLLELSYIKINVGDKRVIDSLEKNNNLAFGKAALSLVLVTMHAVGCGYLSTLFYESLK